MTPIVVHYPLSDGEHKRLIDAWPKLVQKAIDSGVHIISSSGDVLKFNGVAEGEIHVMDHEVLLTIASVPFLVPKTLVSSSIIKILDSVCKPA